MGCCWRNYRCCIDTVLLLNLNASRKVELRIIIATLLLYSINRFTSIFAFLPFDVSANHLNDFLAGLFFPAYTNLIVSYSKARKLLRVDTLPRILVLILACSFVWEFIAPLFLPFSKGDLLDIICYVLGSIFYWLIKRTTKT